MQSIDQQIPVWEHTPEDERIFVFGSNVIGIHGAGAAGYASKMLGARYGIGEGLTGRTYALPTCYRPGEPVTYEELMVYVKNFLNFAAKSPALRFFVSAVGCGIAGFLEEEVGPLFKDAPANCDLPPGFGVTTCGWPVGVNDTGMLMACEADGSHLFRYDFNGIGRGAIVVCDKHFSVINVTCLSVDNSVNPALIKL